MEQTNIVLPPDAVFNSQARVQCRSFEQVKRIFELYDETYLESQGIVTAIRTLMFGNTHDSSAANEHRNYVLEITNKLSVGELDGMPLSEDLFDVTFKLSCANTVTELMLFRYEVTMPMVRVSQRLARP
jgi:hypothetical protein